MWNDGLRRNARRLVGGLFDPESAQMLDQRSLPLSSGYGEDPGPFWVAAQRRQYRPLKAGTILLSAAGGRHW